MYDNTAAIMTTKTTNNSIPAIQVIGDHRHQTMPESSESPLVVESGSKGNDGNKPSLQRLRPAQQSTAKLAGHRYS